MQFSSGFWVLGSLSSSKTKNVPHMWPACMGCLQQQDHTATKLLMAVGQTSKNVCYSDLWYTLSPTLLPTHGSHLVVEEPREC